jgi:hypothetical protein
MTSTDTAIAVTASDPSDRDRQLEEAVAALKVRAGEGNRKGILVTRHDYGSFTVSLSDAVPYGLTRENQEQ